MWKETRKGTRSSLSHRPSQCAVEYFHRSKPRVNATTYARATPVEGRDTRSDPMETTWLDTCSVGRKL